jgi:aspartyl-tRNA synthetase
MYKTHNCGDLRVDHAGDEVLLAGWVHLRRDFGGMIFIVLRDRSGLVQVVVGNETSPAAHAVASGVRSECVIQVKGNVRMRPPDQVNPDWPSGAIEVDTIEMVILNTAKTPPFYIYDESPVDEALRMKYRYLDLRRERMQKNIILRHHIVQTMRQFLNRNGFLEIETPQLFKSTPEGARDYLVPSRIHPGKFYALPQSPQQLKQLLMVAGFERYYQIARCFRDEDLRGDRQPEFTQLDIEMSFVHRDDILDIIEQLFTELVSSITPDKQTPTPFPRLTYTEALSRFGSDKPDLRFAWELTDLTNLLHDSGFRVFQVTIESGGVIKALVAKGCADYSRKQIDEITSTVKECGAQGLVTLALREGTISGPAGKFITESIVQSIITTTGAQSGDLICIVAGDYKIVNAALSGLRLWFRDTLSLADSNLIAFAWILDFPMFEWNGEEMRWDAAHHPFTMPRPNTFTEMMMNPEVVLSDAYDLVCNGYEIASGSIRVHDPVIQKDIFRVLGYPEEEALAKFGHMMEAFSYGAPPHGGIAPGIDRLAMILAGEKSIREVIAFPKTTQATDLMANAPSEASARQLKELHISIIDDD